MRGRIGKVKKDKADQRKKAMTKTWSDVLKGFNKKNNLETADLVEWSIRMS